MADVWTVSDWSIGEADPAAFIAAFSRFADAATALGGAREGMILQDVHDSTHFVVVRRWDSEAVIEVWAQEQHRHDDELTTLVPQGSKAAVLVKVAELGGEGSGTSQGSR